MGADYQPVIADDEEERRKYPYPPVAPIGSTQELESHVRGPQDYAAVQAAGDLESHVRTPGRIQDEAQASPPAPKWGDYAPPEPHGLAKLGHIMAGFNPILNKTFNELPEKRAEQSYKNAQDEYEQPAAEAKTAAETTQKESQAGLENAQTEALRNPQAKPKEEKWGEFSGYTDKDGTPLIREEASGQVVRADNKQLPGGFMPAAPKSDKPDNPEQQFVDEYQRTHPGATIEQAQRAHVLNSQAPQQPERPPHDVVVTPEGKVVDVRPGDTVPTGSKKASEYGKPTADEQRRADLAGNLNENLDQLEDIVNRRPELFGPLAGRWSELKSKFGSDDPDIAALSVLEHQIGMAQISAHGMRSAHGIEGAAASIINGLHSGPTALKGAIGTVRKSVGTFTGDVAKAKGEAPQSGGQEIHYKVVNGQLVPTAH